MEYLKNNNKQFRPLTWIHVGFKNLLHGTLVFQGRADREYDGKKTQTNRRYSRHSAKVRRIILSLLFAHSACCKRNNFYIILTYYISFTYIKGENSKNTLEVCAPCWSIIVVHVLQEYVWNLSWINKLAFSIRIIFLSTKDIFFTLSRSFTSSHWNKRAKGGIEFCSFIPQKTLSSCADDVYVLLHASKTRDVFLHPLNAFMLSFNKRWFSIRHGLLYENLIRSSIKRLQLKFKSNSATK